MALVLLIAHHTILRFACKRNYFCNDCTFVAAQYAVLKSHRIFWIKQLATAWVARTPVSANRVST